MAKLKNPLKIGTRLASKVKGRINNFIGRSKPDAHKFEFDSVKQNSMRSSEADVHKFEFDPDIQHNPDIQHYPYKIPISFLKNSWDITADF